jgi:hypothetical protein
MNRISSSLGLLVAIALTAGHQVHAAEANIDPCVGKDGVDVDLLDPAIAASDKTRQLQTMESLADGGCPDAAQLLGNLLRFGPQKPANPLPKDVTRAAERLEQAALAGNSFAFAELAEMALAEQMAHEAMQWTQIYLWIATHKPKLEGVTEYRGYEADLLLRATRAWRAARLDSKEIQPLLATYLTPERQASIIANIERRRRTPQARPKLSLANRPHASGRMGPHPGYVLLLLEAKPSGEVTRVVVESYAPSKTMVERLSPMLDDVKLTPFEGTDMRSGVLPMVYNAR